MLPPNPDIRLIRRNTRFDLRSVLWRESTFERIRACGRRPIGSDVIIKVREKVAHYAGLETCGSIWACPVCSGKIRNSRALEISQGAGNWDHAGNSVWMVTFTAPHDMGMKLRDLLPVIADSFRKVISGRPWLRIKARAGIVGTIRSMEVTHGENGWHPHLHVLVFVKGDPGAEALAAMTMHFREKWARAITLAGFRKPHDVLGVDVGRCKSAAEAGAYIAKTQEGRAVGNEMSRADLKSGKGQGKTPFQLLREFRETGEAGKLELWHEYEKATRGHQCITWSAGLRGLLEISEEKTDEQLAAEEVGGEDLLVLPGDVWRAVTWIPGLPAYLLDVAELGGVDAVISALERFGVLTPTG